MDGKDHDARRLRYRNIALGLSLGALVVLFFVMSIVKWSSAG